MSVIYVRERRKVEKGEKKPRFRIVAFSGDVKVRAEHLRRLDLELISKHSGAEIVYLPEGGDESGGGKAKA